MHSIYKTSAEAVERLIPELLDKGYQLVTVTEMVKYKHGEEMKPGKVYGYSYFR